MPEGKQEDTFSQKKKVDTSLNTEKIHYEEAMAREQVYREKLKIELQEHPVAFASSETSLHELQPERAFVRMKRKTASGYIQQQVSRSHGQHLPPEQIYEKKDQQKKLQLQHLPQRAAWRFQDRRLQAQQPNHSEALLPLQQYREPSPQMFRCQQPLGSQLLPQNPSLQLLSERQASVQRLRIRDHLPRQEGHPVSQQSLDGQPLLQQLCTKQLSGNQPPVLWCNLCEVPCMNPLNLEQHHQGKKHKSKLEEVFKGKKKFDILWCKECLVPCMNEMAMEQHCVGKKHAARLLALQAASSVSSSARSEYERAVAPTSYAENLGFPAFKDLNQ